MRGTSAAYGKREGQGEIRCWGGIISARLSALATELDTTPEELMRATRREGIDPMVDTATDVGRGSAHERPTDPEKRCVAFEFEDFEALADAVGADAGDVSLSQGGTSSLSASAEVRVA
jgi:hypothetical protein